MQRTNDLYTAYCIISGNALAHGATAQAARDLAVSDHGLPDNTAVEVIGFPVAPPSIDRHTLLTARRHGQTAIRATFYDLEGP